VREATAALILLLGVGSCMPKDEPVMLPVPIDLSVSPHIRIGLMLDVTRPVFTATGGLRVIDPARGEVASYPEGVAIEARARGGSVQVGDLSLAMVILAPVEPAGGVMLNNRSYGGTIELSRGADGVRVVNRITLEEYLVGVVTAEMGTRGPEERAALEAQAVASRTYALRHMEGSGAEAYDLVATVDHQVYNGRESGGSMAAEAVAATRGLVLTWDGALIDAFYSSTCGGRTEAGEAVFVGAARPYLLAQPDLRPDGVAWCAISPRFQWRERWNGAEMAATLRRTLAAERLSTARAADLREIRVLGRTPSGRIGQMELVGSGGRITVAGSAIRRVLAPTDGGLLRSSDFTVRIGRSGGRIDQVELEGRGYGHGVGMCQWGAIGRARAGHDYRTILMSYFPGTTLERRY
jgi:stage II sporulation protein D